MIIRLAKAADYPAIWAILKPVFRAGDTYTIDWDICRDDALSYWCDPAHSTFVCEDEGIVFGTYYLKRNQAGGGSHVCNCGFATSPDARGKGIARAMLDHALVEAVRQDFQAMQFNFVVANNTRAIDIWERAGFETVGRLPDAFVHPKDGKTDALVMWKDL